MVDLQDIIETQKNLIVKQRFLSDEIRNAVLEEVAQEIEKFTNFGQDTISSFAIYIRNMKK